MNRFPFHLLKVDVIHYYSGSGDKLIFIDRYPKGRKNAARGFYALECHDGQNFTGTRRGMDVSRIHLPQKMTDLLVAWAFMQSDARHEY